MSKIQKILAISVIAMFALLALLTVNVKATTIQVNDGESLADAISEASENDVIELVAGTYTVSDLAINKKLTIIGAGKDETIINGNFVVTSDLTLEGVTLSSSITSTGIICVQAQVTLNIKDCIIKDAGYSNNGTTVTFTGTTFGIEIKSGADGSILNVEGSEIYARYGIKMRSEETTVTIDDSKIIGWAALDISDGANLELVHKNNQITVTNSELLGIGIYSGDTNEFGVIVIGGQNGLELNITNTTIENDIKSTNPVHLFYIHGSFVESTDVTINITNSTLTNTDETYGSIVFYYENEESMKKESNNVIYLSADTTINSAPDNVYGNVDGYITLTLVTPTNTIILPLEEGTVFSDEIYTAEEIEGYTFEGWYTDEQYVTLYDDTALTEDTTLYAYYTQDEIIETEPADEGLVDDSGADELTDDETNNEDENEELVSDELTEENNTTENPTTGDVIVVFAIVFVIAVVGIVVTIKMRKRAK